LLFSADRDFSDSDAVTAENLCPSATMVGVDDGALVRRHCSVVSNVQSSGFCLSDVSH